MKAAVATENGLALRDIPQPRPKPNEVLVKVRAAALNRADLATARGLPHGSHGGIGAAVGLEWAGEVVETGAEVKGYKPGDRVMCSGTGGYAEYAVSDWGRVNPIPNGMSFEQAATLPVALSCRLRRRPARERLKVKPPVRLTGVYLTKLAAGQMSMRGRACVRLGAGRSNRRRTR